MASWYSIHRNLPDAIVEIQCIRRVPSQVLFDWVGKFEIPYRSLTQSFVPEGEQFIETYKLCQNHLWITPDVVAVNEFKEDALGPSDIKYNENTTFVKIGDRAPFAQATSRFWTEDISVNETKVLKLWERISRFYSKL